MNGSKTFAVVLALLFALFAGGLAAQETGPVFHRLTWQPVDYASGYEVVVEILTASNEWVEQFRRTNETEVFVDCPLVIGKYRFRVSALDLLGRPGPATEWAYFELRAREIEEPPEPPEPPEPQKAPVQSPPPVAVFLEENDVSRFMLELFYAPVITLPFSSFNEIYSTDPFQPVGFAVHFTAFPFESGVFTALGFGATASWNFLATEIHAKSRYTHISGGQLFAIWRIQPAGDGMFISVRAGGGASYVSSRFDFNDGQDVTNQAAWNPSGSVSVSLQGRLGGSLFLDAGVEYFHIFSADNLMLNYLRPMIGIGWRF
jgi:hypothetical protein